MADQYPHTERLQMIIDCLQAGDPKAKDELITVSLERLRWLAHKMLKGFPRVHRWNDTDDLLQNAWIRLSRALKETHPDSVGGYLGLAATLIRRDLIDLFRHEYGPEGSARHHATDPQVADSQGIIRPQVENQPASESGPLTQLQYQEFHEHVDRLPDEEREVFQLLFYLELTQAEIARCLNISVTTVKRRYRSARLLLHKALHGKLPEV